MKWYTVGGGVLVLFLCLAITTTTTNAQCAIDGDCSTHGTCNTTSSQCKCTTGYTGSTCTYAKCGGSGLNFTSPDTCCCFMPFYRPMLQGRTKCLIGIAQQILNDSQPFLNFNRTDSILFNGTLYNTALVNMSDSMLTNLQLGITRGQAISFFAEVCSGAVCPANVAIAPVACMIMQACPGAKCLQCMYVFANQRQCDFDTSLTYNACVLRNTVRLEDFALDAYVGIPDLITLAPSPYHNDRDVALTVSGTVFADEGNAKLVIALLNVFNPGTTPAPSAISPFLFGCPVEDSIQRMVCLQRVIVEVTWAMTFTGVVAEPFNVTTTLSNGNEFDDTGLVNFLANVTSAFALPAGIATDVFYLSICNQTGIIDRADCMYKSLLAAATCTNNALCPDNAVECAPCLSNAINQTFCDSNSTLLLATCLLSTQVSPEIELGALTYPQSTFPSGSGNIDTGQSAMITRIVKALKLGNINNFIKIYNTSCASDALLGTLDPFCSANTCNGGSVTGASVLNYQCSCPSDQILGPGGLSCHFIDADSPNGAFEAAFCVHGLAIVVDNLIACDCTGSGYTGDRCELLDCLHGGVAMVATRANGLPDFEIQTCSCVAPYIGPLCASNTCLHSGVPSTTVVGICTCLPVWGGALCATNLCTVHGTNNGTACACAAFFKGTLCQTKIIPTSPQLDPDAVAKSNLVLETIVPVIVGGGAITIGLGWVMSRVVVPYIGSRYGKTRNEYNKL